MNLKPEAAYLRTLALTALILLGSVVSLNWLANPFSLFDPPTVHRINTNKPGYIEHLRLTHAYRVMADKPDCILLGTSRAGRGLRPDHPALRELSCYNLSLPAISMYEMRRYLQHAQAVHPLKLAIVSLDFRVMNASPDQSGAFVEARLAVDANGNPQRNPFATWAADMVASLLSFSALEASLDTVRRQSWVKDTLRRDGLWAQLDDHFNHPAGFEAYTRNTLRRFAEARQAEETFHANTEHFRQLVREAHAHRIDLRLFIPPSHAWHWQTLWQSGLWPRFEEMKRALVTINEEEALRAGRAAFVIQDFSGSQGPALEDLPTDAAQKMKWYWEPVHFKTELGDRVLAEVMAADPANAPPEALGTRLSATSLDGHLAQLRKRQAAFEARHPEVAERIRELASEANR